MVDFTNDILFGGYIKHLYDAAEGDISKIDNAVDWQSLHLVFCGAFSKLEDDGSGVDASPSSPKIESLYSEIDSFFDSGQINDATYQFAADIIQLIDPDEQDYDVVEYAKELSAASIEDLKTSKRNVLRSGLKKMLQRLPNGLNLEILRFMRICNHSLQQLTLRILKIFFCRCTWLK